MATDILGSLQFKNYQSTQWIRRRPCTSWNLWRRMLTGARSAHFTVLLACVSTYNYLFTYPKSVIMQCWN